MANIINPKVFVVMPVFNRLKFTKKCLSSLINQNYKNIEIIVIDDGSTDGTSEFIKKNYPKVKIITGNGNWWWTRSMYEGVLLAMQSAKSSDFILEMNNDCYFDKNYITQLLKTAKKYSKSIIGSTCVLSDNPQKVVEIGIRIDWPTGLVYAVAKSISDKLSYYKNMEVIANIDALPGKGTLIPISVFKKVGNFNYKQLPHYIADYEFTIRAKNSGFNLIVDTKAIVKHYWNATGISSKDNNNKSYKQAWSLLLGRKSMNNIVDWVVFVLLCCPRKYLIRNLYFSLFKILKAIFSIWPFYYLKPIIKLILKIYHYTKLALYRTYLNVVQFPKYHLK